jgi:uncharacterized protein
MSRPRIVEIEAVPNTLPSDVPSDVIDASVQAHAGSVIERRFSASRLPRLSEAGITEPADARVTIRFSAYEGRVALDGVLNGTITMICQRCMQPTAVDVEDRFRLLIVDDEADPIVDEGGFESVVADPARLDLRWLAEEQLLLAVPLVAKHADDSCANSSMKDGSMKDGMKQEEGEAPSGQRPFANLRNLLRDQ